MPLFEVETTSHIMIACAMMRKPLGLVCGHELSGRRDSSCDPPSPRRLGDFEEAAGHPGRFRSLPDRRAYCLAKAAGDKLHAVRLYMQATGTDLDGAEGCRVEHVVAAGDCRFPIPAGLRRRLLAAAPACGFFPVRLPMRGISPAPTNLPAAWSSRHHLAVALALVYDRTRQAKSEIDLAGIAISVP